MLTSITLQNFKSFGEEQTIPLQPITVLVGPNNSGKSNLVSLARFIRNAATGGAESAFEQEGGVGFVFQPIPPEPRRLAMAVTELQKPEALDILRQRRSFQHFEAQLAEWL